jgi:hypothetical protein
LDGELMLQTPAAPHSGKVKETQGGNEDGAGFRGY